MFKNFKKMSRGKKVGSIVLCLVILALVAYVVYNNFKPKPLTEYNATEVYKGDIQTAYETTGTVMSNGAVTYTALQGVKVQAVNVSVGDVVKKGDVLAVFDTTPLNDALAEYSNAYNKAKKAYDSSLKSVSNANSEIASANNQIAQLDREIAALEKEIETAQQAVEPVDVQQVAEYSQQQIDELTAKLENGGFTQEEIANIVSSVTSQQAGVNYDDLRKAVEDSTAARRVELASKQSQRQMLETQITIYNTQTDDTVSKLYKSVMEQKKADYDNYKALVDEMSEGWVAKENGIVTEVNITGGEVFVPAESRSTVTDLSSLMGLASGNADVSSILGDIMGSVSGGNSSGGTGMVIESNDELIAEFSVGKYDILNIKKGQKVTVSSLGSEYEGEVVYVSATASESSSFDISTIASTFTGGSGASSSGALVRVTIKNPDEKIIIGFDVDIKINTQLYEDVLVMPIDAVVTDDGVNYVYTVDSENRVHKTEVVVGNYSDNDYELISGVKEGTLVVDNPKTTIKDGEKISIVKPKS